MKSWMIAILFCGLLPFSALAKKPVVNKHPARKPQAVSGTLFFKTVYGERASLFRVTKMPRGGRVDFVNSQGSRGTKDISAADYEFLKSRVSAMKGPANQKRYCMRNYMEVKSDSKAVVGCLGANNKLSISMQQTVNILSMLF